MQCQIPIIPNQKCKEQYRNVGRCDADCQFDDRVVCAGFATGGKDSCQGDSGGPVMLPIYTNGEFPFFQIGIISWAEGCGQANLPGVNTNVQFFADWIKNKVLA